jgi:hypothetical protein
MRAELQLVAGLTRSHSNTYDWRQSGWHGWLGVRLADGAVVALDCELSQTSWGDYSGSGCSFDTVTLFARPDGWLLRIESTSSVDFEADQVSLRACWQGTPDGRTWQPVPLAQAPDRATLGAPVDTLGVPPPEDRLVGR